ncbi:MAG: DHH family phosphoesterase [Oscillospiraceae bacterium]|jgi:phosphoglycolate phosphatase|nr:DHH family phosphoesterase [Oscillospiraceae bacterium]
MFKLSEFLKYGDIAIQCHDNPDADAISSAFGIYAYLKRRGKSPKIIYSGFEKIKKRNIQNMVEWLNIPVEHVKNPEKFPPPDLLVCVDCQYGEGNITKIKAGDVAIIDHHLRVVKDEEFDLGVIQSNLGSCATLVWDLLKREGFDFAADKDIPASLYYGLLTDTNDFSEISHPLDKDMRDSLQVYCDRGIVRRLRLCNLTIDELEIAGVALLRNYNNFDKRYALFKSEYCDPNILGFISDIALQVDTVDVCAVYTIRESGARLSVRSCLREVMASEYAEYITRGVGSGGGHRDKAGGWLQKQGIDEMGLSIDEYMKTKTAEYFDSFDVINAFDHNIDLTSMKRYRKKPVPKGFAVSSDVFPEGTPMVVRTLEGDLNIKASPDVYLMIGVQGEVKPIKADKFDAYYGVCDEPVDVDDDIYTPTVRNEATGEVRELLPLMTPCISHADAPIFAAVLERGVKVFTEWTPNGYLYGSPGDYLVIKCDDINDVYILKEEIFFRTYEEDLSLNCEMSVSSISD